MEWVETTGRTVAEAKERALDQLGVDNSDAEFEVVSEPKTGLFGRLKAEARVRARVTPTTPRSKEQNQRNKRGRKPSGDKNTAGTKKSGPAAERSERPGPNRNKPRKPKQGPKPAKPPIESMTDQGDQVTESDEQISLSEQGAIAEEFLRGFFDVTNTEVSIASDLDEEEEIVRLAINGDGLGHLIGPRGSTLHSLQEITRTVVQRQTGTRSGRIVMDVCGYREKRKAALGEFARKVAAEVIETGDSRQLEPMNPADRKIVHDSINEIDGVATSSEGEEPRRYIVIKPS